MIRVYLLIIIIAAFFWFKTLMKKTPEERSTYIRQSSLSGFVLIFILLAVMGKLNWILAAFSVVAAFVARFLPTALRYAPQLQRLWFAFHQRGSTNNYKQNVDRGSATMTLEEAGKILGISMSATRQEVIDAHRKLILKNHPDRGGTSYLAAQINRAKEVFLKH